MFAVLREDAKDVCVESVRMVHLEQVAMFVDVLAVDCLGRCQHEQAVEVEVAFCAATAPSGFLFSDGDSSRVHSEKRGIVSDALWDICFGLRSQLFNVVFIKNSGIESRRASLLVQSHLLVDPVFVLRYHALDLASAGPEWGAYEQTFIRYLKTDGFSFAADEFVFHADILSSAPRSKKDNNEIIEPNRDLSMREAINHNAMAGSFDFAFRLWLKGRQIRI